jgi:AcrR family transcriptional regulator
MPKPTFENLPAAKRQAIIDIAIDEFAAHPYATASVSRIVERAGISKGSIYQYFENKQELFLYLLEYAAQSQLRRLAELKPPDQDLGFFAALRWQMSASVYVGLTEPRLVQLIYHGMSDDLPFRDEVQRRLQLAGTAHLQQLLTQGIVRGEIDSSVDPELAVFVIKRLTGDLGILITRRLGLSLEDAARDIKRLAEPEAERIYDAVVQILQYGLGAKNLS